ncbi:FAD/NAD(P)-binding domain-containing protein [Macrolepiota fuliginosa MF-IS2]|uniref:FAD/NAD(P)-binding domain-containing protein n=1 Tax=Macrolepiota fuliginosa MF-IS2 TaxID=1400762 RepID=A0A9P6C535_9AGAR|nr:FAD/NAD(P)-binding domain-containing protein [Macrolepiota fuliginosa MF-IS2]
MGQPPFDPGAVVTSWLNGFANALQEKDAQTASESIARDGWLRDSQVFCWDNRTLQGREKVYPYMAQGLLSKSFSNFQVDTRQFLAPAQGQVGSSHEGVLSGFLFETGVQWCQGYVQLMQDTDGAWRALAVYVAASDIKDHEEAGRELGLYGGHTVTWPTVLGARRSEIEANPHAVIIGGGQTGVMVAARFKQMRIPALVIDINPRLGDAWRNRYDSMTTTTPRMHDHFLYQRYPQNWPFYTPKDKLADWIEHYVDVQDLTVWTSSKPAEDSYPVYDDATKRWTIIVDRAGERVTLHPAHIICCMGTVGKPISPEVKNRATFKGTVIHGAQYKSALPFTNKRVVVVGAGTTAGDVCLDLSVCADTITLIQRSESTLVPSEVTRISLTRFWPDDGSVPTEIADFKAASTPIGLSRKYSKIREASSGGAFGKYAEMYKELREKGMIVNNGTNSGLTYSRVLERFGGFMLDVGCSKLVISGRVKVKHGVELAELKEESVVFTDGSEVPADAVIFATGFDSIHDDIVKIFGKTTIDRAGQLGGTDEEGELKNVYRPTGHPALWYCGGGFQNSRYGSKQLAMQIKATDLGLRDA